MPSSPLTTIGLVLTLASLTGTFFYIQLSQWLRDILALRQKAELNKRQGDENQKKAIVECRIEYRKLNSWHTYTINAVVIAFVIFIVVTGLQMVGLAASDPLQPYVARALWVFLALFTVLSFGLLLFGWLNATEARKLFPEVPPAAKPKAKSA
ncbi:MAG TPA: hypothetical protein VGM83_10615 [Devosiaceae bacterium]|jgi:K+-transporting ATPase A subunit